MAVTEAGRIVQCAPPEEILDHPATRFVAEFTRSRNIWEAECRGEDVYAGTLLLGQAANPKEGPCWAIVRPERLSVHDKGAVGLPGTAAESRRASHALFTRVELNGVEAWASDGRRRQPGTPVTLEIPQRALWLLPRT